MERTHDWIEHNTVSKSGIEYADSLDSVIRFECLKIMEQPRGGVYVPRLLVRNASVLVDVLGRPMDVVLLVPDAGEATQRLYCRLSIAA
jgi:hypothetical protein